MQGKNLLFFGLLAALISLPTVALSFGGEPSSKEAQASEPKEAQAQSRREEMQERRRQWEAQRQEAGEHDPQIRRSDRRGAARGNWWEDDDLAESLELTSDQQTTIAGLHERLQEARQAERQLNSQRRQRIPELLGSGDRDGLEVALEAAAEVRDALHQAESDWLTGLMDALDSDQLSTLATEHPRALTGQTGASRR